MKIEFQKIAKSFGRQHALAGVDLTFESGSRTALVGPNGSGKSTLIRALMGFIQCKGAILVNDQPLRRQPALDHTLAYIPQFAPQTRAPVQDLVEAVCLLRGLHLTDVAACAEELAFDLEANMKKEVGALSGGMRQKLMIGLALAAPVELLVMDEPTASLDAAARAAFLQMFDRIAGDTTVILASHRPDELRSLVDHIALLQDGQVAFHGGARNFLSQKSQTVVELRCDLDVDQTWLRELGFKRVHPQQWIGIFSANHKEQLLKDLGWKSHASVLDLIVHDVENVDLDSLQEDSHEQ
ncbi:MAG: ABC transporter ATP-binding protein [Planctomycetes bacterium]|nr:ABC transporter ATP-binding protein [Planctomycetota bacterium]